MEEYIFPILKIKFIPVSKNIASTFAMSLGTINSFCVHMLWPELKVPKKSLILNKSASFIILPLPS